MANALRFSNEQETSMYLISSENLKDLSRAAFHCDKYVSVRIPEGCNPTPEEAELASNLIDTVKNECLKRPVKIDITSNKPSVKNAVVLTPRELIIVRRLLAGESNVYMAKALNISVWTVKRHFTNIFDKTGMCSRMEVAMWAVGQGIKPYFNTEISQFTELEKEDKPHCPECRVDDPYQQTWKHVAGTVEHPNEVPKSWVYAKEKGL